MNTIEPTIRDVAIAIRILALNNVLDAYGHVSIRHPERPNRFFLARSVSPAIVEMGDIVEFNLDGTPVDPEERRPLYADVAQSRSPARVNPVRRSQRHHSFR
jgi:HCOMODA/2-hydroxy-3-carboxy-muconic semialdehyde decarboxylase